MNPTWNLSLQNDIQLLQVGDLLSEYTNKEVLKKVDAQLRRGYADFIVDMSALNYINSVGLNLLIMLKERAEKKGGRLVLANSSPTVIKLLEMTKLYPLFELTDTLEAAFAAFPDQKN